MQDESTTPRSPGSGANAMSSADSTTGESGAETSRMREARDAALNAIRTKGSELGKQAGGRIEKVAAEGKDTVAQRIARVAAAMRAAGEAMQGEEPQIANYPLRFAERLERVSTQLRDRDVRALMIDVEDFARRRPELFLGGVLVAGVAVGRFLRASTPDSRGIGLGDGSGIQTYRRSYRGTGAGNVQAGRTSTSGRSTGGAMGENYASDRDYSDSGHESDYNADGSVKGRRNEANSGNTTAGSKGGPTASGGGNTLDPTKVPTKPHGDPLGNKTDE